ncbi:MAG: pantoate--beta-alanine ligase [Chloroflexi bacterium]|jgi:pantoate--beta-alanine ligase|nr:pantoate--beta-alanine ligase [Anaerolineaceae bacterium]NMB90174.1 pantoate--beta-alanine ligase [Chloroflexota bacterium]
MQIVHSFQELRSARSQMSGTVGLVPTMGFLHEGHLSLVRAARAACDHVAVSIFVNPTQFGPKEDLANYPRDLDHDAALLEKAGVDLVWNPTPEEMYPQNYQTWVSVEDLTRPLEGGYRPGHFRGVTTVVAKLFNAVQPHKAFFGQKDAQQAAVIRQMVRDLSYPIEIVVCPIQREADGLAMSSRNTYLSPQERRAALVLSRSLFKARDAYTAGSRDAAALRQLVLDSLAQEPLANVQYVSCADFETLQEVDTLQHPALLSMAVYVGKTRLIDNVILG